MILEVLADIWKVTNLPCAKRLKAILPLWLPFYDKYIIILLAMGWLMTVSGFFLWYKIRQRFEDKLLQNAASGESR